MVNKVILVGNLGKDPVVRRLESGVAVATFPLATSEYYRDRDGNKQQKTEWHNIVLWRDLAEIAEKYLRKGSQVYLEGKISSRNYTSQDGATRYITEVIGNTFSMIGNRPQPQNHNEAPPPSEEQSQYAKTTAQPNVPAGENGSSVSSSYNRAANTNLAATETPADDADSDDLPF